MAFIEVDLAAWEKGKQTDRSEAIYHVDFYPIDDAIQAVAKGKTEIGLARMVTANSTLLIFLAGLPEFQHAMQNQKKIDEAKRREELFKQHAHRAYRRARLAEAKAATPEVYDRAVAMFGSPVVKAWEKIKNSLRR